MITSSLDDEDGRRGPHDRRPRIDPQRDRARLRVLAEVSTLLASSDDYLTTLDKLTEIAVPLLGDWCSVHVVGSTGQLDRVAIRHRDPARLEMAEMLANGASPSDPNARGAARVVSAGKSEWVEAVNDELLADHAREPWARDALRLLGLYSYVSVPLIVRARVIGVFTLVRGESGESYDRDDAAFTEELARRVAMYIENAMLREVHVREHELIAALEKSNHDLDQFAYVTSHDLRAPLRGIANLSQWMEEDLGDRLTDQSREYLQLLRGRVRRLEDLIQGVLDYSRAGRVADAPTTVDVGQLVREVLDLIGAPKQAVVEIDPNLPTLSTTRVPLQQVLINLIANAFKYNPKAAPRLHIGAEPIGDGWEFYVRDDGPGIASRYHAQIWGLFQTLQSRDRIESTGIGLAIVRKIVEAHGGRAWIDSEEGKGATFRFTWPKDPPRSRSWDRHMRKR